MTGGLARAVGALLFVACGWWALGAANDVVSVSPVHWPILLPYLTLSGIPALVGTFTAAAIVFGRPGARALVLAFALTLAQAVAVAHLAPEIPGRYGQLVEQGKQLVRDSIGG
jgi:hypothetical protein